MPELMPSFPEPRSFRELPQELKRDLAAMFLKLGHLERLEQASLPHPDIIMRATRDLSRRSVLFEIFEHDVLAKDPREGVRRICCEEISEAELATALGVRLDGETQRFFAGERAEWSEGLRVQLGGFTVPGGERVLPQVNEDGTLELTRVDLTLNPRADQIDVKSVSTWADNEIIAQIEAGATAFARADHQHFMPGTTPPPPPTPEAKKKPPEEEEPRRRIWLE